MKIAKWMSSNNWTSIFFKHLLWFLWAYGIQLFSRGIALFLLLNPSVSTISIVEPFLFGLKQDMAVASYYLLFLASIWLVTGLLSTKYAFKIRLFCWVALHLYLIFVILADNALLYLWGSHVNSQALVYFQYPKQLLISVPIWILMSILVFFVFCGWVLVKNFPEKSLNASFSFTQKHTANWLILFVLCAIGIRGGIGKVPLNVASTQQSHSERVNLISINSIWNANYYLFSAPEYPEYQHLIQTQPNKQYFEEIFGGNATRLDTVFEGITLPENIILISMEGIGAAVSELIGGSHFNGLPLLDSWCKQHAWYFDQAYATGDRTDKGIASLYSAWPGQPWEGILHEPERLKNLPHIGRTLSKHGKSTYFFYGGDAHFANIRYYMKQGGIQHVFDAANIDMRVSKGNWGYQDSELLKFVKETLEKEPQPYFAGVMLLSSHEPYDIVKEHAKNDIDAFYKSVQYVDTSIHDFLSACWSDSKFDHTWFIVTSDHGKFLQTTKTQTGQPEFFRIPLCIIGKSLSGKSRKISTTVSQTDVFNTLLQLYQLPPEPIKYSRSVLQENHPNRAWFQLFEVAGLIKDNQASWLSTNPQLLQKEMPFNSRDSAILTLESEIISDFFRFK